VSDLRLIERLCLPCNWGFRRENKFSEGQRKESLNRSGELGLNERSFLGKTQILRDMYGGKIDPCGVIKWEMIVSKEQCVWK